MTKEKTSDMKTILVAEDDDSNYLLMTYILRKDYRVVRARTGAEAVEMAESGNADLVLMDIKMPVMDGLEATGKIKSVRPGLPVVALTANAFESDREQALAAGCDDFLQKPVNAAQCLSLIAKYV